ncbi:MAG: metallophosphoesterase, partial [Acidobacteriaceae bacterium]
RFEGGSHARPLRNSSICETSSSHKRDSLVLLAVLVLLAGTARALPGLPRPPSSRHPPSRHVLVLSDIHFDPFADPALASSLAREPVRKWEAILNRSSSTAYSPYGQDTNWRLLQSVLDAMRKAEPNPALVMVTGDMLAHEFPQKYAKAIQLDNRNHYRAFVSKTVAFVAMELRQRYKDPQILFTPGNNDDDCGDYEITAGEPFLSDTARTIRGLARGSGRFTADWKSLGSYSVRLRGIRGLRIVTLNSVFFSHNYRSVSFADGCSPVPSNGPARNFTWLESTLSRAAQNREKVWLMMHIPPGMDGYSTMVNTRSVNPDAAPTSAEQKSCSQSLVPMWKPFWTDLFDRLLSQYSTTIPAIFAGHDHTDDFRVIHAGQANQQFVLIDPPVSPIYGQNPSFRVVTFAVGGELVDQTTWYLTNLQAARSAAPGIWMPEYTFTNEWHTTHLDAAGLNRVYDRIRDDPAASERWLTLLDVSSTDRPVPAAGVPALECAITALDPATYKACYCPAP